MQREPPPFVWAAPDERNILIWNFLIRGPPECPYEGGEYHGVIIFPSEYPFKPPGIKMLTPSGRFQPDKKICFSMSDYHPGSWNPAWSVATILTGLLSFMLSDEMTTGSLNGEESERRILAARSHGWNISQKKFRDAFPEYSDAKLKDLPNMGQRERGKKSDKHSPSGQPPSETSSTIPIPTSSATRTNTPTAGTRGRPTDNTGWGFGLRQALWEKWRWGALIAIAVLVSRLSSSS